MLDFASLRQQINEMVQDQKQREDDFIGKLTRAYQALNGWERSWEALAAKVDRSHTSWLVAELRDAASACFPLPERPEQFTVAATDGSQIFPDRHEISSCYLINVGGVVIHYGTGEKPLMYSRPKLFYADDDLYGSWGGRKVAVNHDVVSTQREWMEWSELALHLEKAKDEKRTCVGLSDGTLILWPLEGRPRDFQDQALGLFLRALDRLRMTDRAVAGYISNPASSDVTNALKIGLCPEHAPDCDHCAHREEPRTSATEPPCAAIEGVSDQLLFSKTLKDGERSAVFGSRSKILDGYGAHRICFCYLNVGAEICRLEFPLWVADDRAKMELLHATVYDQVQKGSGYPVTLAEAHEKVVVRAGDRDVFYKMLRDAFVSHDVRADISRKSFRKRSISV